MRHALLPTAWAVLLALTSAGLHGQDKADKQAAQGLPPPPMGFDVQRDGIDRGKLESVTQRLLEIEVMEGDELRVLLGDVGKPPSPDAIPLPPSAT